MLFVLALLVASATPPERLPPPRPAVLTTAQEVRRLSKGAVAGVPVDITGTVTFAHPRTGQFYIQDDTAGIAIRDRGQQLKQADHVRVTGRSAVGPLAPRVVPRQVGPAGRSSLPLALPFALTLDESRWLDGQWVTVWAVAGPATVRDGDTHVEIRTGRVTATVLIPGDHLATAAGWEGSAVRLTGVCVPTVDAAGVVSGPPRVLVQNTTRVKVFTEPPAELGLPRPAGELLHFVPDPHPARRLVTVRGVVGGNPFSNLLFIQDGSVGLRIEPAGEKPPLSLGAVVEAAGRLDIRGNESVLYDAVIRPVRLGRTPEARPVPLAEAMRGKWPGVRVRIEAVVQDVVETPITYRVFVRDAHTGTGVIVVPRWSGAGELDLPQFTRIAVVGCPSKVGPGGRELQYPELVADGPTDVTVLERPPAPLPPPVPSWWTQERVTAVVCAATAVSLIGLCWVFALRRTVRRRTEEVQAAFERQAELQEQLRQSQKLEAVGQLAGGIAHDFNNLLTVVNGCADLLAVDLSPTDPASELVADIRRAGDRAAALTGQLLLFSRRKRITPTAVDLNAAVADAVRLLGRLIPENVRVSAEYAAGLSAVRAEVELVHQIVLNLALNSRDAMPTGGALTLTTAATADGGAQLIVADTGTGMDAATQKRIFEPFFTTKEVGQGTGLGLATVYGIVQAVGGRVRFRSALGQGTTFEIDFPPAGTDTKERRAIAAVPPPAVARGVVLLVEDDDGVRLLARRVLEAGGYQVLVAADPEEGEKLAADHPGKIDLLLTDVVMPNMNGGKLAERVRRARPGVKVVFMSGYTPDEVVRQGVGADPQTFLPKPFTPPQMLDKLRNALMR